MGTQRDADSTGPSDPAEDDRAGRSPDDGEGSEGGPAQPTDEHGRPLRYVDSPGAALAGEEADEVPEPNEPA